MMPPTTPAPLAVATAPAKVILLGEHAVVYGAPAIAMPVTTLTSRATVQPSPGGLVVAAPDVAWERSISNADLRAALAATSEGARASAASPGALVEAAVTVALDHAGHEDVPDWRVEVTSAVPSGGGLGSSASVAVATIRAVLAAAGEEPAPATVAQLARVAESVVHGMSSGIDPSVIALGAPILFRGGRAIALQVGAPLRLLVADSGVPSHTAPMVARVRESVAAAPETTRLWFDLVAGLVEKGAGLVASGDGVTLGRVLDRNHLVLQALRVSTPLLDALVAAARDAGAWGAKLSGAGGGGCAIALAPDERIGQVARALHAAGARAVHEARLETSPVPEAA